MPPGSTVFPALSAIAVSGCPPIYEVRHRLRTLSSQDEGRRTRGRRTRTGAGRGAWVRTDVGGVRRVRKARRGAQWAGHNGETCALIPDETRVRMSMLKIARWIVAAAAVGALVYVTVPMIRARARTPRAPGPDLPGRREKANLDFTVSDMNGQKVALSSFKGQGARNRLLGHVVPAVQGGDPGFVELQRGLRRKGLQIVGVSVDDTPDKLKPFAAEFKMNYPVLVGLDRDDLQDAYAGRCGGIPTTFVISRDGRICRKNSGLVGRGEMRNGYQGPAVVRSASCSKGSPTLVWPADADWRSAPASKEARDRGRGREGADLPDLAPRARPADLRLPRIAAPVDATRPAGRRRVRRRRLVVGRSRLTPSPHSDLGALRPHASAPCAPRRSPEKICSCSPASPVAIPSGDLRVLPVSRGKLFASSVAYPAAART